MKIKTPEVKVDSRTKKQQRKRKEMTYKQPLSHLETYDYNFQPHNPFQLKMSIKGKVYRE